MVEKKQKARNKREHDYSQVIEPNTSIEEEKQPAETKKVAQTVAASAGPTPAKSIENDATEQKQQKEPPVENTP